MRRACKQGQYSGLPKLRFYRRGIACYATDLAGLPLAKVLFDYTNLYIRFGLGRDFNPAHPI